MSTEDLAQRIWNNGGPLKGSLAETYLAGRALTLPVTGSLRFAASLPHKSGVNYPAMLAQAVDVNGAMTGIQRTFLAHDGSGKAPLPTGEAKMSLGALSSEAWFALLTSSMALPFFSARALRRS